MKQIDLSIIIVSWNVKDLLKKCLDSIFKNQGDLSLEVIVVDNASSDGTSEMVRTDYPQVKLITNKKNLGFATANNQGIKQANGGYVLFLNPDTEILNGTLEKTIEFMKSHPDAGVAGCQLLNPDKTVQSSVRRFPTFWSQLLILYKLHHLLPNLKTFKKYLAKDFDYSKTQEVDQVMGSFFITKRKVIEKIGGFDENFYIWFEEIDFCKRVKEAGYKVYYYSEVQVIHHGAASFKQVLTVRKQKIFNQSMRYYFKKHHGFWPWFLLTSAHLDSLFLAWLVQVFRKKNKIIKYAHKSFWQNF